MILLLALIFIVVPDDFQAVEEQRQKYLFSSIKTKKKIQLFSTDFKIILEICNNYVSITFWHLSNLLI